VGICDCKLWILRELRFYFGGAEWLVLGEFNLKIATLCDVIVFRTNFNPEYL
jgi:hypothetical protein